MNDRIDTLLNAATPRPQAEGVEERLKAVEMKAGLAIKPAVLSPYARRWGMTAKRVAAASFVVVLLTGTAGTVAAESARPGDVLFPVDRAIEQLRLLVATPEARASLESRFFDERLTELAAILHEETKPSDDVSSRTIATESEARVADAVAVLFNQANRIDAAAADERLNRFLDELETIVVSGTATNTPFIKRLRIDDHRIEMRTEKMRIRIDDDHDEDEVRIDDEDNSGNKDEDDDRDNRSGKGRGDTFGWIGAGFDNEAKDDDRDEDNGTEDREDEDRQGSDNDDDKDDDGQDDKDDSEDKDGAADEDKDSDDRDEDRSGKDDDEDKDDDDDRDEDHSGSN